MTDRQELKLAVKVRCRNKKWKPTLSLVDEMAMREGTSKHYWQNASDRAAKMFVREVLEDLKSSYPLDIYPEMKYLWE